MSGRYRGVPLDKLNSATLAPPWREQFTPEEEARHDAEIRRLEELCDECARDEPCECGGPGSCVCTCGDCQRGMTP